MTKDLTERLKEADRVFLQAHDALEAARDLMRGASEPQDVVAYNQVNAALYAVRGRPDLTEAASLIQRLEGERGEAVAEKVFANVEWSVMRGRMEAAEQALSVSQKEVERLRGVLEDALNPMRVLERRAEAEGTRLNGMAYTIANDLGFVKSILREGLQTGGKEHG